MKSSLLKIVRSLPHLALLLGVVFIGMGQSGGCATTANDVNTVTYGSMAQNPQYTPQQRSAFAAMSQFSAIQAQREHERDIADRSRPEVNVNVTPSVPSPENATAQGDVTFLIGSGYDPARVQVKDRGKQLFHRGENMALVAAVQGYVGQTAQLTLGRKNVAATEHDLILKEIVPLPSSPGGATLFKRELAFNNVAALEEWVATFRVGQFIQQIEFVVSP